MARPGARILTLNGGSSSIKVAVFESGDSLQRILTGGIERIGSSQATLNIAGTNGEDRTSRTLSAPDHAVAMSALMDEIVERVGSEGLMATGHRLVHGGPKYCRPQLMSVEMLRDLQGFSAFDPEHLPAELLMAEAVRQRLPTLPQVTCFDTAFATHPMEFDIARAQGCGHGESRIDMAAGTTGDDHDRPSHHRRPRHRAAPRVAAP